ncbi:type I glyceraldehyde-3-phosphate dehydrogenase [Streptomyces sp. PR69]|uniref:type I glyceraldehyde-3-phosphate dehydrogenase n=1 Tax=Streptomyces sp. PR69 TaxID=2984950 RepID=UPI002263AF97|nr:type I glyceraldehyde-3-phosphate dehydrogenase [Streptomyces sp. PR69]
MTLRLAINGFGRIGRTVARAALGRTDVEVVAVNDLADPELLAHLFQYDSVHGRLPDAVRVADGCLEVAGRRIRVLQQRDPADLPWAELRADVVVESTGVFTDAAAARRHLDAGARRVLISAPARNEDLTVVMGVNSDAVGPEHTVLSNASCTTNCAAMLAKVLDDHYRVLRGLMNTVHAYTSDQRLQDVPHKDYRRARAAAANIVPTSTGAARAIGKVLPRLDGRLDGLSMRVPVIDGSVVDLTVELEAAVTAGEVNEAFRKAAEGELAGFLEYTEAPIVSSDIVGSPASCTFDAGLTMVSDRPGGGSVVKVVGWYDNETGFSHRTLDLALLVGDTL